jgi:hypothetical protein
MFFDHEHLKAIRAWAEKNRTSPSSRRILELLAQIDESTDPAEAQRLGQELADRAFDIARRHNSTPWEFYLTNPHRR